MDTEKPRGDGGRHGREATTSPGTDAWSPQKLEDAGRTVPWILCRKLSPGTPTPIFPEVLLATAKTEPSKCPQTD